MNEYSTEVHKNRGRVIAHVFYSELEKIAKFGPTGQRFRQALKATAELGEKDIARIHQGQPKKGLFNIMSKERVGARLKERAIRKAQRGDVRLAAKEYKGSYSKAMNDLAHGNATEQTAARNWLKESGGGVHKPHLLSRFSKSNPTGASRQSSIEGGKKGTTGGFFGTVGKATTALGVGGAAVYGGKKYLDSKKQSPYGAYSGAY